jgi:hypothetical protein
MTTTVPVQPSQEQEHRRNSRLQVEPEGREPRSRYLYECRRIKSRSFHKRAAMGSINPSCEELLPGSKYFASSPPLIIWVTLVLLRDRQNLGKALARIVAGRVESHFLFVFGCGAFIISAQPKGVCKVVVRIGISRL